MTIWQDTCGFGSVSAPQGHCQASLSHSTIADRRRWPCREGPPAPVSEVEALPGLGAGRRRVSGRSWQLQRQDKCGE